jgi:hypothetical protein
MYAKTFNGIIAVFILMYKRNDPIAKELAKPL